MSVVTMLVQELNEAGDELNSADITFSSVVGCCAGIQGICPGE